jgi:hypothetical protein
MRKMSAICLLTLFTIIGCYRTDSGEGVHVGVYPHPHPHTHTLLYVNINSTEKFHFRRFPSFPRSIFLISLFSFSTFCFSTFSCFSFRYFPFLRFPPNPIFFISIGHNLFLWRIIRH